MRQSPSGAANPTGSAFLNGITVAGNAGSQSVVITVPGAKVGDTVAYSFNTGSIGPMAVGNIIIPTANQVIVNLFNYTANPFTLNNITLFVEVIPQSK